MPDFKPFPPANIPLLKLMGPSFIILALGFGSGEIILWPYLTSNVGLGIAWGALIGITCQFFINMEIERYALVKGESVFVGLYKLWPWTVWWFIGSTFIGFGLPGIVAAAAKILSHLIGLSDFRWLAIGLLLLIGCLLSWGKTIYNLMETTTRFIIFIGFPLIIILAIILSQSTDWLEFGRGLLGWGQNYHWWPESINLATLLAAFAYSGAGGNLNLTQSIYIKEKGYGMGSYAQKITGLFNNQGHQTIKLAGENFTITENNIKNFHAWWKKINTEHLIIFWLMGFIGMALLMVLSYTTTFGLASNAQGIDFIINEGQMIGQIISPLLGLLFLIITGVMLWQTQLGVTDSTSRIMAENWTLQTIGSHGKINLSKMYFTFVWAQIALGIILFLFNIYEPKSLIVAGAIINAVAMFVHIGLINIMNHKLLPPAFKPRPWRTAVIIMIFIGFGIFVSITLWHSILSKYFI